LILNKDHDTKTKLKKYAAKTAFGYQGFSLPEDHHILKEIASIPLKKLERNRTPLDSSSDSSSARTPSPIKETTQKESWFGYEAPEHLKRRAELLMTKKAWRMADHTRDQHYNKYRNQESVTTNLQNMINVYEELKSRSTMLIDDQTVTQEEYREFLRSMELEEEQFLRTKSPKKRQIVVKGKNTPKYAKKVGNRKVNKKLSAQDVSLFEMSGWKEQYNQT
jgi:hypothetical protein